MTIDLGPEELVLVGFSKTLLAPLAAELPAGCAVVVEEPDIARKRDLGALAAEYPAVGRIVCWEYQRPGAMAGLLRAEPSLKGARAVLPGVEYAVAAAAELAALLGLPGAGARAGAVFRDKVRQRHVAAQAGIRNPPHAVVSTIGAAAAFFRDAGGRCVVKPSSRQASLGVRFVTAAEEVADAFRQARDVRESLLAPSRGIPSEVIIELAAEGREYSVEMLLRRGQPCFHNVTAKHVLPGPFPVELGHVVPGLPGGDPVAGALVAHTARLAEASGFRDGILHCEWMVTEQGPVFIECAARMPGDEIGTLITMAYRFPLTLAYLRVLLGADPALPGGPAPSAAAIRFVTAPPGIAQEVAGAQDARQAPGVRAVRISAKPGELIGPLASSWDRAGYVIAHAPTPEQADARAAAAAALIRVRTAPAA